VKIVGIDYHRPATEGSSMRARAGSRCLNLAIEA
jgi:hypothetical protein